MSVFTGPAITFRATVPTAPIVPIVMAGLDPAIHAVTLRGCAQLGTKQDVVDGRVKPGHDVFGALREGTPTHD